MLRSQPSRKFSIAMLFLLCAFTTALAHAQRPRIISIAAARQLPLGTTVTVAGLATTPSGAFESSFFDKGFGIQDQTDGIFVSLQTNLRVLPRTRITVTGVLKDASGLLTVAPASPAAVTVGGIGAKVEPVWVTTSSISENTEGRLVRVVGRISQPVSNDLPFGYKFFVDDGSGETQIFINTQTGIDVGTFEIDQLVSITGFSSQFEDHYEIDPRRPSDISRPADLGDGN